jgi:RNA polymerase sigma-70 factor (sigma-E family)
MDVAVIDDGADVIVGFDDWVESRSKALTRFAYLITGSREEAEDALQSALTSACARWSRVSRTRDPEAYVRRMIVNAHVSLWRSFRRRETPVDDVRDTDEAPDPARGVTEADRVWRLCAGLPRRQRAAVVLRFYEDLGYPEIAGVLGVSEATARVHIHRALKALRESIGLEDDDER